jgi:hypothetical protein
MKNFLHECNGKIAESSLEIQAKCGECNCDENDIAETPCECACHDD